MNKYQIIKHLTEHGDSIISYVSDNKEFKHICATIDFSTKYIRNKRTSRMSMSKTGVLVWSWTDDKFVQIPATSIKSVSPLSDILKNTREIE